MRITLLALLFACFYASSFAQHAVLDWQRTMGGDDFDIPQCVAQTADGGRIMAATTYSANGDIPNNRGITDVYIVKMNADGTVAWQKTYGGSSEDGAYAIAQTADGGYILAGYTKSNDGDVHGFKGIVDCWILKLNGQGHIEWERTLGGSDYEVALSIVQTADKGFIMAGYTMSKDGDIQNKIGGEGNQDVWLVKLDANGQMQWQKTFGGTQHDMGYRIIAAPGNAFVVASMSQSTDGQVTNNKGQRDIWLFKIDVLGNLLWQRSYGGSGNDFAYDIKNANDGGYILTGSTSSADGDMVGNHGQTDAFVMKLDANGLLQWNRCFGGSALETAKFVHPMADGSYIVAGTLESVDAAGAVSYGKSDYWLLGLSATGAVQWQKNFGGSDIDDLHTASYHNNSVTLAGTSFSVDHDVTGNKGGGDCWIVQVRLNGPVVVQQPTDQQVCAAQQAKFQITASNTQAYQWQVQVNNAWQDIADNTVFTGATTPSLTVHNTDGRNGSRFRCKLSNNYGHIFSAEALLQVGSQPIITLQPQDIATCSGTDIQLQARAAQATSLQWQVLDRNQWVDVPNAKHETLSLKPAYQAIHPQYRLKAANNCGTAYSNAATLRISNCMVPNAFSPNGDNIHDTWDIAFLQQFANYSVQVFSRAGSKVFEMANGLRGNWNGMYNGSPLPAGVYYYIINIGDTKQQLSGSLLIIR